MSTAQDAIHSHTRAIADLLANEAAAALERLRTAEAEAIERIQKVTPAEYDYAAAAAYLSTPRRTLERRVAERAIAYRKEGSRVLFTRAALDEYRNAQTVTPYKPRPLHL